MKKLFFLFLLIFVSKIYSYKGPFYVATTGNDTNNGSFTNPFKTIQKAINTITSGTTSATNPICFIKPGIYNQNIIICSNKNTYIKITALSNYNPPIILGTNISISNSPNVIISNLIIKKFKTNFIKIINSTNIKIFNNTFASNYGIKIENSKNVILTKNKIFNQTNGIFIKNSKSISLITNNILKNNYGIKLEKTISNIITRNSIFSNFYGIFEYNSSNNIIRSNYFFGKTQSLGIKISNSFNPKIYKNFFKEQKNYSIYSINSFNIQIINNTIIKSLTNSAIFLSSTSNCKIINNIFLSNKQFAIENYGSSNQVLAYYNIFYGNLKKDFTNISIGNGNIFDNPLIDINSGLIKMVISPAVDSATNIPEITINLNCQPDIGFMEYAECLTAPSSAPTLNVKALNCCEILLTWNDLPNESSYTLFRNFINDTNSAIKIAGLKFNILSYVDKNLEPEKEYYYWIKAYNRLGESPFSAYKKDITKSIYYPLEFKIFPTYFNPSKDKYAKIFFSDETLNYEVQSIKIYNFDGDILREWNEKIKGTKFIEWDGKDKNGKELKPGVYIIHITGMDLKYNVTFDRRIKFVIIK